MYSCVFFLLLLVAISIQSAIFGRTQECIATAFSKGQCHECMCSVLGRIYNCKHQPNCTVNPQSKETDESKSLSIEKSDVPQKIDVPHKKLQYAKNNKVIKSVKSSPIKRDKLGKSDGKLKVGRENLPEIKEGEPCIPGQTYRMECNKCQCLKVDKLFCTKMACASWHSALKLDELKDKMMSLKLPEAPKDNCVPGKLYMKACARCFCDYSKKIICSDKKNEACDIQRTGKRKPILEPTDIRPPFRDTEVADLPTLPSTTTKCVPGKIYQVECNHCVCLENFNLLCDKMMCLSYDDMNRIAALDGKGNSCSGDDVIKTENNCVTCKCIFNKTKCVYQPGCVPEQFKQQTLALGQNHKTKIDGTKDVCLPGGVYLQDCNRCYCQPDRTLRCTQKTCISYRQAEEIHKQRLYLEQHGL